ncbi:hypothetical protein ONS95_007612 [Cadophora gregata]|uniref:uncharacterized protein n=1 Tax=Cadophora gregata TaxID=51156 RepID=UPI0026DB17F6|nr:uncharacterized protein ONS95_007612 [Cadophora gregata]KAK0118723.1 hypothetical protein ONS96_011811 [Cadophora gregata f. sp. sojae]KAK0125989.1 hypothetical protein ONS95_007612 [Cadophora gregata]
MAATSLMSVILAVRICAGIFAGAGLALYSIIFARVIDERFPATKTGLTALPVAGAVVSILWNIAALAFAGFTRPIWFAFGDVAVAAALTALGAIGLRHDTVHYLSNGMYLQYDNGPWLNQEIAGGSCLLISVLLQLLLVLVIILENRRAKKVARAGPAPPYTYGEGPYSAEVKELEKEKDVEIDWKSVVSEESMSSSVKKPEPVVA